MRLTGLMCLFFLVACGPGGGSPMTSGLNASDQDPELRYPLHPLPAMTPGALCQNADEFRYPERVAYCRRNVPTGVKHGIFVAYEKAFGFSVHHLGREKFKIDHFIPLCMGGANAKSNLWPQFHKVYEKTDPIEFRLCELMGEGQLSQDQAIGMIRDVKDHLDKASSLLRTLEDM